METEIRRYFMAVYDSAALSLNLERGLTELTAYKAAVDEAASELVNLVRPRIPNWYKRDMRVSYAEEVFLQAATKLREEL